MLQAIYYGRIRTLLLMLLLLTSGESTRAIAALPEVDGCTEAMYQDRTLSGADRELLWDYSFPADPERCLKIRIGQSVRWQGNFGDHPLEGNEGDDPNPIDGHAEGLVTFDRAGQFGFRCNFHLSMRGAIWVVDADAPRTVPTGSAARWLAPTCMLLLGLWQAGRRSARRT